MYLSTLRPTVTLAAQAAKKQAANVERVVEVKPKALPPPPVTVDPPKAVPSLSQVTKPEADAGKKEPEGGLTSWRPF